MKIIVIPKNTNDEKKIIKDFKGVFVTWNSQKWQSESNSVLKYKIIYKKIFESPLPDKLENSKAINFIIFIKLFMSKEKRLQPTVHSFRNFKNKFKKYSFFLPHNSNPD